MGPRAIVWIDQLRSQESFSAHIFLSIAVKCALCKLLYKIYALTYVSMKTYTTQVRFHSSLAAIYRAQHDTSSALKVRFKAPCAAGCARKWRVGANPRGMCAQLGCGARAAELYRVLELPRCPRSHSELAVPSASQCTNRWPCNRGRTCHSVAYEA